MKLLHKDRPEGYAIDDSEVVWKAKDDASRVILFKLEENVHERVFGWRKKLYLLEANGNYKTMPSPSWEALSFYTDKEAATQAALGLAQDMYELSIKFLLAQRSKAMIN